VEDRAPGQRRLDGERIAMRAMAGAFASRRRYEAAQRAARLGQGPFVRGGAISRLPGPLAAWTTSRDLQPVPAQSFRDWWRSERGGS
jgi:L-lactate dehydrogenase complex protein LldF